MLFVIKNLLTLERLLPFSSVGYRARLLFICGLHKKNKGKVFSVYDLKAHRLILGTVPLILNPVIYIGLWLTSGPVTVSPEKIRYPLNRSLDGLRVGMEILEKRKLLSLLVLEPQNVQRVASSYTDTSRYLKCILNTTES